MDFDIILVGGGLQNGLLTLALAHHAPHTKVALIERESRLGGNQTWSFHRSDVPAAAWSWLQPLVVDQWNSYDVVFPKLRRTLEIPYASIRADHFDRCVRACCGSEDRHLLTSRHAVEIDSDRVRLDDGQILTGQLVIDARGLEQPATGYPSHSGYQKFLGLEVRLGKPADLTRPVIMDATVGQVDGYRFMYILPYSSQHLLVEDTYFSNTPDLDQDLLRQRILGYLQRRGLDITEVVREECGVLPMPWKKRQLVPTSFRSPLVLGYRSGFFHPATGYSVGMALKMVQLITHHVQPDQLPTKLDLTQFVKRFQKQARFARRLNHMLFKFIPGPKRHRIFERFYRLEPGTIQRFYAMETTRLDRLKILMDRPPFVPWFRLPHGPKDRNAVS